jgi:hypothetical protein
LKCHVQFNNNVMTLVLLSNFLDLGTQIFAPI